MRDGIFKKIIIFMSLAVVVSAVISFFLIGRDFALGLITGGVLSSLNFVLLLFIVKKIFFGKPKTQIIYAFLFMFKLSLIGGIIFWLFNTNLFVLDKAGFLTGISLLFLMIMVNSIIYGNKLKAEVS